MRKTERERTNGLSSVRNANRRTSHQQVIDHTDNVMAQETEEAVASLQVVSVMSLPPVGSTQTVETSSPDPSSPPLSPQPADLVADEEIKEEESRPGSPKIVTFTQNPVFTAIEEQTTADSFSSSSRVTYASSGADFKNASPQYITASPSRSFSPTGAEPQRLPSVLEAAMKAEPKVEVERYVVGVLHHFYLGILIVFETLANENKLKFVDISKIRRSYKPIARKNVSELSNLYLELFSIICFII